MSLSLVQEFKRITREFDLIRSSFLSNRNSFPHGKYESKNNNYRFVIKGNYGMCQLMITDELDRHLFTITQDSYYRNDRSIMYVDGSLMLMGLNAISHVRNHKIYFNKLLTKEKYFHYSLNNDMPSYEYTVIAIEMKYNLQRKNINYYINIPFIDEDKLKNFSLNVDEFIEKYKNDAPW